MRLAALVVGLAAALTVAPAGAQSQPRPGSAVERQAVELFGEARALYERGEYRAAVGKLEAALALDPDKELVYNLAVIHEKLAEVDTAERYYRRYLQMEPDPKVRERVNNILKRIEGAKKELADRRAAEAKAAAAQPPPVAPPAAGDQPGGRRIGPPVIIAGSVAAGAAIVGTIFAISAISGAPGDDATTGSSVTVRDLEDDAAAAHTSAVVADVSFLIAAVASGAAVYFYLTSGGRPAPAVQGQAQSGVSLQVGPARGLVRVRF